MKKLTLFTTIIFLFCTGIVFSQKISPKQSILVNQNEENIYPGLLKNSSFEYTQKLVKIKHRISEVNKSDQVKGSMWVLDSTGSSEWNSELSSWDLYYQDFYIYDGDGNLLEWYDAEWDYELSTWILLEKVEYSYDINGNKNGDINYYWDSESIDWIAEYKGVYANDEYGKILIEMYSFWDEDYSIWTYDQKIDYSYDTYGNLIEELYSDYDVELSSWVVSTRGVTTYDSNENPISETWSEWDIEYWLDYWKASMTYDSYGNEIEQINYYWDDSYEEWIEDEKYTHAYDTYGNETERIKYNWDYGSWEEDEKEAYVYDSNENILQYIFYFWDFELSSWVGYYKGVLSYDENGNNTSELDYDWDYEYETWFESEKTDLYWSSLDEEEETTVTDYEGNVYQTVKIGNQRWIAENLRSFYYADGYYADAYYFYDDNSSNYDIYGLLYPWDVATRGSSTQSVQGICPNGYHLPSDSDWMELESALGMQEELLTAFGTRGTDQGTQLKEGGTSGFNGQLGGFWWAQGASSYYLGDFGYFWTSSETDESQAIYRALSSGSQVNRWGDGVKLDAMSVRCVKDPDPVQLTFNVDMGGPISESSFIKGSDHLYISGSMNSWSEPGSDVSAELTESTTANIYTVTMPIHPGTVSYKYFINSGWVNGEWDGDPNREIVLGYNDSTINDIWGPEPANEISDILLNTTILPHNMPANETAMRISVDQEQSFPPYNFAYTFTLVDGEGSADNNMFQIIGDTIKTSTLFNFDAPTDLSIRVQAFDGISHYFEKSFVIELKMSGWEKQATGSNSHIDRIIAIDQNIAWANAQDGGLARTIDGGATWDYINDFAYGNAGGFFALNKDTAWIIVSYNLTESLPLGLYKTTDGGVNWIRQTETYNLTNSFPNFVYFWNQDEGFVAGDNLEFYATSDGGTSWYGIEDIPVLVNYQINSLNYASVINDTIWYSTEGAVYRSPDKGQTWEAFSLGRTGSGYMAFKNAMEGLLYLRQNGLGLLSTSDGGETWTEIAYQGDFRRYGIKYDHHNNRYVAFGYAPITGEWPGLSYSSDNGLNWNDDPSFYYSTTSFGGDFSQADVSWLGGSYGSIFKSLNAASDNNPPVLITEIPDQMAREGSSYNFTIPVSTFSDPDEGDQLSYSARLQDGSDWPAWLSFTPATQAFSGTPVQLDRFEIKVTAEDLFGYSVSDVFTLNIEGYQVVTEAELDIDNSIPGEIRLTIPAALFTEMGLGSGIVYTASLADGSPLPTSIIFDPETLFFRFAVVSKKSLASILGSRSILVTGTDSEEYIASVGFSLTGDFVSVKEQTGNMLNIYPNPSSDKLYIENNTAYEILLEMYDLTGNQVYNVQTTLPLEEIDVRSFSPSVYFLKITYGEETRIEKIVIQ